MWGQERVEEVSVFTWRRGEDGAALGLGLEAGDWHGPALGKVRRALGGVRMVLGDCRWGTCKWSLRSLSLFGVGGSDLAGVVKVSWMLHSVLLSG